MPKYLISGSYVGEGIKGLLKEGGTKRKEAVELRWLKPVRPGDQLTLCITVRKVKPSRSKPDRGVLFSFCEMLNQVNEIVVTMCGVWFYVARSLNRSILNLLICFHTVTRLTPRSRAVSDRFPRVWRRAIISAVFFAESVFFSERSIFVPGSRHSSDVPAIFGGR